MHPPSFWWLLRAVNIWTLPIPLWSPNHFAVYLLPHQERAPYEHSSVQFSHSVMSDSLWPHEQLQPSHPLSSLSPPALNLSQHQGLSQWIGSSHQVARVSTGASASLSAFPVNIQGWCPLGWTGLISLLSKGLSRVQHHNSKASILQHAAFFMVQLSHP